MTEYRLKLPEENSKVEQARVGDVLFVDGEIAIARDQAHKRLLADDVYLKEIVGLPIFHCGPIAKLEGKRWTILAGGPTTSTRMDKLTPGILKKYGARVIIGKGGLGDTGKEGLREHNAAYVEFTGGASALAVSKIRSVKGRYLEELGPTELVWVWEVNGFGPLLVTQDSSGGDLKDRVISQAKARLEQLAFEYSKKATS
jgi:tartrate/fumarate subfamily iron-sulfur-dependent hydro-lyase beta chain